MEGGRLWAKMHAQPRHSAAQLQKGDIPPNPGVYAWYRDGEAIYVGKAASLRKRLWNNHLGRGAVMTGSAFRRNVAQQLGFGTANAIKTSAYVPTPEQVQAVRDFIGSCEVAWRTTDTAKAALDLESDMKREWMPPLTRM